MSEQPQRPRGTGKVRPAQEPLAALAAHCPWMPVEAKPEVVTALQACYGGRADAVQQKLVIEWIVRMSGNDGALYFPGAAGERDTAFALGRKFVGDQIVTFLKVKLQRNSEQG